MPKKPRILLLDAVAVIGACEVGTWLRLVTEYEVLVSPIVMREAHFYDDPQSGRRQPIDLAAMVQEGTIRECEIALAETYALLGRFDRTLSLHLGEAESLAYLVSVDDETDIQMITSDTAALKAIGLLDLSHRSICLGDALRAIGLNPRLEAQHETAHHKRYIGEGIQMRIQGRGLTRS